MFSVTAYDQLPLPSGHLLPLRTVDTLKNFVKMPGHAGINSPLQNPVNLNLRCRNNRFIK